MATTSIQEDIDTLVALKNEKKVQQEKVKKLNLEIKKTENRIAEYFKTKSIPGTRYKGTAIMLDTRTTRLLKKKGDKIESSKRVLLDRGFTEEDAIQTLKEIEDSKKGAFKEDNRIMIGKIKEK